MKKQLLLTLIFALFLSSFSWAGALKDADTIVKTEVKFVSNYLRTSTANFEEKKTAVKSRIEPFFEFDLITKLTVGKTQWTKLKPAQQQQLAAQYKTYLMNLYLGYLNEFKSQVISYGAPKALGKTKAMVPMFVQDGEARYVLEFYLYSSKKGWKVYDLKVEGVSIIRTYRKQFEPFLVKGNFKGLIKQIQ